MNKQYIINNLYEAIHTTSTITCTKCGAEGESVGDDYAAAKDFHEEGWHASEYNVYCPDCQAKRIKKKNK